jgi:hypothetical protein
MLEKIESDGYIHKYSFEMTDGGMAFAEKTPHISHHIMNKRGTYNRRLSVKMVTKEAGNNFYKELIKKGYKRVNINII